MTKSFLKNLRRGASSVILSVALAGASLAAIATPAYASTALTADETTSLQTSLTAAIQAANGDETTIEAAIAQAVENAITAYGYDAAGSITSSVLSIAESAGATSTQIGTGLAQASASEAPTSTTAATAIASTLANEGKTDEVTSYQSTVTTLGYANLATTAGTSPSVTGQTSGAVTTSSDQSGFSGNGSGSGGGCLNPSCTKL